MEQNQVKACMQKQREARDFAEKQMQELGRKYQEEIRYLQLQLETDLLCSENKEKRNEILEKYRQQIQKFTEEHLKNLETTLKECAERFK